MRPTLHKAIAAISAATGIRRGRVTHAARQLQQVGALPVAAGSEQLRLEPGQIAALIVATVLDAPLRSVADLTAAIVRLELNGVDFGLAALPTLGDVLAAAIERRVPVAVTIDLAGDSATVRGWGDQPLNFGRCNYAGRLHRTCVITPDVTRDLFFKLES